MWLWMLTGCGGVLGDHCVTERAPGGELREFAERDMKGAKLATETVYFAVLGDPVGTAENTYDGDLWIREEFDASPGDGEPTRDTRVTWDAEGRPIERLVVKIADNTQEEQHTYTWDGDRVASSNHVTLFTSWDEVWEWDGNTATVTQTYFGGRVITEIREFAPTPLSWPVLEPDRDLPGLAFVDIGVDDNDNGTIEEPERVFERELDEEGIPIFSRFYDATGSLFSQFDWGTCPVIGE